MELTLGTAIQLRGDAKKAFTLIESVIMDSDNHVVTVDKQDITFEKAEDTEVTFMSKGNRDTEVYIQRYRNYLASYKRLACAIVKANVEPACILEKIRFQSIELRTLQTLKGNIVSRVSSSSKFKINSVTGVETYTSERPTFDINKLTESIESLATDLKTLELKLSELNNTIKVDIDKETFASLTELVVTYKLKY